MTVDTRVFTADDLLRIPEDGFRHELVRGELRTMSPAGGRHGRIAARIAGSLIPFVLQCRLGEVYIAETGFVLARNPDTVRAPDVAFVGADRVVPIDEYFPGPPDLAFEVISPSDLYSEVAEKTREYLRAGTRAVVVVDPRTTTVNVHRPDGVTTTVADVLAVDDVVPGWKMTLAEVFPE